MNKTKIDWADSSWNPVTGCLHGCEYCYARKIAERFGGNSYGDIGISDTRYMDTDNMHVVKKPCETVNTGRWRFAPYPFGFEPTFHRYRLEEPAQMKKPRTIFVCSMADLFGEWVPDEWIREVFEACKAAPQHRNLFLTKNPYRYLRLLLAGRLPLDSGFWYGTTMTEASGLPFGALASKQNFISLEPIRGPVSAKFPFANIQWVIVGAETGNRKGKVIPEREWIMDIKSRCAEAGVPLFMKASLHDLMGDEFVQEYPWEVAE